MEIADVVGKNQIRLICVEAHTHTNAIYDQMKAYDTDHVVVMEGKDAVGIIDRRGLLDAIMISPLDFNYLEAKDIMTRDLPRLDWGSPIETAASLMQTKRVNALPLYHDGECIGLITKSDLLRALLKSSVDQGSHLVENAKAKSELVMSNPLIQKIAAMLSDVGI